MFPVVLVPDWEMGGYVIECPVFHGCVSQGETVSEALENTQEAIELCLEVRQEEGLPLMDAWKVHLERRLFPCC